ncbi:MAG: DUF4811 domain-containing protein [Limosilactobacillus sp.]|uniref:DUF4811 domain-containing protein n=1 Tax=Limosilactobacillus sp. TaxID=2773925 RepID=UPI0026F58074|nr:DUF4811 domain-containing protein [Limosilactobacillus sp.]
MVILTLFFGAVSLFLCTMFIKNNAKRNFWSTISAVVFTGSSVLMIFNYSHHFGMKQVTTEKTIEIYSASNSDMPLALYQPVGTSGQDDVYIYNRVQHQVKPNHTQADEYTTSKIKWTNKSTTPHMVVKETRWRYKNNFFSTLYMWSGMDGRLVKRVNTLEYPTTYVKISTTQANALKKLTSSPQAQQNQQATRQQMQSAVAAQVQAEIAKNPNMTAQQIKDVTTRAQQKIEGQAVKQMLKQLK